MSESPTPTPRPRLSPWLAAIGVLAVAVVAFGAVQLLRDDDDGDSAGTTVANLTAPTTTSPQLTLTESVTDTGRAEPPEPGPASLRAGGRNLFPALDGSLAPFAGRQVEGKSVEIVQVNGTDSIWVGRAGGPRLLVVLNLKGEPFPSAREGGLVDFVGQMSPNGAEYGVTDEQSRTLLQRQGHHAFVSVFDFKLH